MTTNKQNLEIEFKYHTQALESLYNTLKIANEKKVHSNIEPLIRKENKETRLNKIEGQYIISKIRSKGKLRFYKWTSYIWGAILVFLFIIMVQSLKTQ